MCIEKLAATDEFSLITVSIWMYKLPLFSLVTVFLMGNSLGMKSSTEMPLLLGAADLLMSFSLLIFIKVSSSGHT